MNIKSITIQNVRGLGNHTINLDMIPNKPSILVAPNGSGKSSFAFAFQWLNRLRIKLNEDDAYQNNPHNKPVLIVETDEPEKNVYTADENKNEISKRFGVFVINSGIRATSPGIRQGYLMGKSHIVVPDIVLLEAKPEDVVVADDFEAYHGILNAQRGFIPSLTDFWTRKAVVSQLDEDLLKCTRVQMRPIVAFIHELNGLEGTIQNKYSSLEEKSQTILHNKSIEHVLEIVKKNYPADHDMRNLLRAVKIVDAYFRSERDIEKKIKYCRHATNEESIRKLFRSLKETWREINPTMHNNELVLSIGDCQRISNGERDILILIGMLEKAKHEFTKKDNILVIDEVFDYLDDANLIAAQHYIKKFIDDLKNHGKNIYPILLSHINPAYFRTFAFREMKVYYLKELAYPNASQNMMKLLRKRDEYDRNPADKSKSDLISKYMLHFHTDYTQDLSDVIGMNDPNWGNIPVFKRYCSEQLIKYLDHQPYDALAVCVQLRELIEKHCYDQLAPEYKQAFLDDAHGTEKKIDYMEERGYVVPETFSLLGLIYNDPLHPYNKNKIDLRQTLYSRLENNTIRGMVEEIKEMVNN